MKDKRKKVRTSVYLFKRVGDLIDEANKDSEGTVSVSGFVNLACIRELKKRGYWK